MYDIAFIKLFVYEHESLYSRWNSKIKQSGDRWWMVLQNGPPSLISAF